MLMQKIAVLVPCYNEGLTVEKVISDFKRQLPEAVVYVCDNNSKDDTFAKAERSGAVVSREYRQGKGNVVRSMFRDIDADIYVLVDGDDTYPAEKIRELIRPIAEHEAEMVVGDRLSRGVYDKENKRQFHGFGNALVRRLVNFLFQAKLNDIMSGYRVFSKRFVKNYPVIFSGFQIETDMSIFAIHRSFRIVEIPVLYRDRPKGSVSKLNTYQDGMRVLLAIFNLYRFYRPLEFFAFFSGIFIFLGVLVGIPVIAEYIQYQYVFKVPSAILASGLMIVGFLSFAIGIILDALHHSNREIFESLLRK